MGKRIAAIGFIFFCTAFAWAVLASTIFYRTYSSDSQLRGKVALSWGAPQEQSPPTATYVEGSWRQVAVVENGKEILRTIDDRRFIPLTLQKSRVNAALHSDYRRKGLLWYSTYQVHFGGVYEFVNPDDRPRDVTFTLHLPAEQAIYDDMVFAVNGTPVVLENQKTETYGRATVPPHSTAVLNVGYRSQGLDTWHYNFGDQVSQLRDFELRLTTDFQRVRFSQEYAIADARNPNRSRLGTGLELQESCVRIQNRTRASAKTAARSTRRTNQCLRSRIAAVFLLCAVRPDYDSRHQSAPP